MTFQQPPVQGVGWLQRLASAAVLGYIRRFPVERGKWWLMRRAGSFLVVELEPGLFIRIAGLTYVDTEIVREGMFERETVEVFTALLVPGMTVLDVGANVGQYTLIAARHIGPAGRVHAFEPTPRVAALLRENVALNRLANVVVSEAAVSNAAGEAALYFADLDDHGVNSLIAPDAGPASAPSVRVPTVTLDEYVAEHGLHGVDVLKMDIEGAEPLALRGGRALFAGDQAPVLIIEVNPKALSSGGSDPGEVLGLLREYGYTYHPIVTYGRDKPNPWTNGLAAKPAHLDRFPALAKWGFRPEPVPFGCAG